MHNLTGQRWPSSKYANSSQILIMVIVWQWNWFALNSVSSALYNDTFLDENYLIFVEYRQKFNFCIFYHGWIIGAPDSKSTKSICIMIVSMCFVDSSSSPTVLFVFLEILRFNDLVGLDTDFIISFILYPLLVDHLGMIE